MKGRPSRLAPLTPAQQALAADLRYLALARQLAAWAARGYPRLADEFESAALLGLVQAAAAFDPDVGVKFNTYATYRITGAIEDARRAAQPAGYRRSDRPAPVIDSLDLPLDAPGRVTLGDTVDEGCDPPGWELEYHDEIDGLARRTTPYVSGPFRALYTRADCLFGRDAGAALGLSESRISQIHSEAIGLLSAYFAEKESSA